MSKQTLPVALASAFLAIALSGTPASGAQPTGLAYDELTKIVVGQTAPEPGSFASDFQTASASQKAAAAPGSHHGLFGGFLNTIDSAKNAMQMFKNGVLSTQYYLGGWERRDDLATQTATITKPRERQTVVLNLAKKTYHIVDASAGGPMPTTNSSQPAASQSTPPPTQPGSGNLDITVSSTALGPMVIDNIATQGYKIVFNLAETHSTGSCKDGTFQTSMTEYVSSYAQPHAVVPGTSMQGMRPEVHPELMALQQGCSPTIKTHYSGGAHAPADRLVMWMLVTIEAGAPSAQGQMRGGFSTLVERGNVRTLGAPDKNLFSIPAGFTKE